MLIDPEDGECENAYPSLPFTATSSAAAALCAPCLPSPSVATRAWVTSSSAKVCDVFLLPGFLRLFVGPPRIIMGMTNVDVCTTDDFTKCVGA